MSFKIIFSTPGHTSDNRTNCKFHNPRDRVFVLRHGHILNMHYPVLSNWVHRNDYNAEFFYDGAVDYHMQILALLIRSKCRGSDIQVTMKACGPLVKRNFFKIIAF